jgi:putative addiction module component (TIGR02574 family)
MSGCEERCEQPSHTSFFFRGTMMGPTMKELGIDRFSPEQRIALALEIWESLGDGRPPGRLTAEQRAEMARRNVELDANPGIALTWEQIRASIEAKP